MEVGRKPSPLSIDSPPQTAAQSRSIPSRQTEGRHRDLSVVFIWDEALSTMEGGLFKAGLGVLSFKHPVGHNMAKEDLLLKAVCGKLPNSVMLQLWIDQKTSSLLKSVIRNDTLSPSGHTCCMRRRKESAEYRYVCNKYQESGACCHYCLQRFSVYMIYIRIGGVDRSGRGASSRQGFGYYMLVMQVTSWDGPGGCCHCCKYKDLSKMNFLSCI